MDISDILQRIDAGDRDAFAEVVTRHQHALFGFLGRMGLSAALVEDLAQETFIRAWRHLGDFDPARAGFSTWLFTIARNLAFNECTRAASRREVPPPEDEPEAACHAPQPPEAYERDQTRRRLQAALRQLPLADRSVIALAYVRELDGTEIARIEGCSPAAVKTRLHRARQRLRELLETDHG